MPREYKTESLVNFFNSIDARYDNLDDVKVIFDVGSLHCLESIEFSKKYKNAKIYAFEANRESYELCVRNTISYPNIKVINTCINEYDGTCKFYPIDPVRTKTDWFDGNRGASSMFLSNGAVDHIELYVQNEVEMDCMKLETFCKNENINKIDAIWMDLQGAELLALKGLGRFLDDVSVIQTELEINPMYRDQCLFREVDVYLTEKQFIRISGNTNAIFGEDFIYVRR